MIGISRTRIGIGSSRTRIVIGISRTRIGRTRTRIRTCRICRTGSTRTSIRIGWTKTRRIGRTDSSGPGFFLLFDLNLRIFLWDFNCSGLNGLP